MPAIFGGFVGEGGLASDAIQYHLPQINAFVAAPFDLVDYPATVTTLPFYHALMGLAAAVAGVGTVDNNTLPLRLLHFLISLAGPVTLFLFLARALPRLQAFLLGLPLATSWYVTSGAIFYGTDGPGLTLAVFALIFAISGRRLSARDALVAAALAGVRHLYFPVSAGALFARALFERSVAAWFQTAAVMLPAALLLGFYVSRWGGLTPPGEVAAIYPTGVFPYAVLGHLAVAGLWGGAFACLRLGVFVSYLKEPRTLTATLLAVLAVFAIWITSDSNFSVPDGRFGSWVWRVAEMWTIGGKSLIVLGAAIAGSWAIILFFRDGYVNKSPPIAMAALATFILALALSFASYQRYSEPICIACFAIAVAGIAKREPLSPLAFVPLIGLSVIGIITLVAKLYV